MSSLESAQRYFNLAADQMGLSANMRKLLLVKSRHSSDIASSTIIIAGPLREDCVTTTRSMPMKFRR